MPPALTVISLRGPFSKTEIHRSKKMERHPSLPPTLDSMFTGALQVLLQESFVIDLPLFCGPADLIFQISSLPWG